MHARLNKGSVLSNFLMPSRSSATPTPTSASRPIVHPTGSLWKRNPSATRSLLTATLNLKGLEGEGFFSPSTGPKSQSSKPSPTSACAAPARAKKRNEAEPVWPLCAT
eukprot:scaffold10840_cov116-Isochrysis_galbana.AAC.3